MGTTTDILGGSDVSGLLENLMHFVVTFGTDFFAFILVAGVIFAFAFYFGRDRLIALAAGIYTAVVLYQTFPYSALLPQTPLIQIGLFLAFVAGSWIAFSGMSYFLAKHESSQFGTIILSVAIAGLLLAVGIHVLPVQQLYTFSAPTLALFSSAEAYFLWLVAPLGALFFFGR